MDSNKFENKNDNAEDIGTEALNDNKDFDIIFVHMLYWIPTTRKQNKAKIIKKWIAYYPQKKKNEFS